MAKNLVIVESPAKVKTIKKFLGSNYTVDASGGHVRDLPKSQLGFDPENDYEPKYITIRGKGDVLARLRTEDAELLTDLENRYKNELSFRADPALHYEEFRLLDAETGSEVG